MCSREKIRSETLDGWEGGEGLGKGGGGVEEGRGRAVDSKNSGRGEITKCLAACPVGISGPWSRLSERVVVHETW